MASQPQTTGRPCWSAVLSCRCLSARRWGAHPVSGDQDRREPSVGNAVLAYWLGLRGCQHEMIPGKPWSIFQLQHALRLWTMTNQVEHQGKVKMGKTRKAA